VGVQHLYTTSSLWVEQAGRDMQAAGMHAVTHVLHESTVYYYFNDGGRHVIFNLCFLYVSVIVNKCFIVCMCSVALCTGY
jgi:hypothetical protein